MLTAMVPCRAEESKDTHIDLLSRERKFRAAVEAGLREKASHVTNQRTNSEVMLLCSEYFVSVRLLYFC